MSDMDSAAENGYVNSDILSLEASANGMNRMKREYVHDRARRRPLLLRLVHFHGCTHTEVAQTHQESVCVYFYMYALYHTKV